ncbi:MAG: SDR family oxidoreductase [Gammaproteobacteria bacterium]|nr:SDR family oxidoreductase [Gammaproteobacteria bacterium]MBU2676778.1 SDR family oxidoreductase [Gammaproteobacteria bacterium]NNL50512.1 SDR family oxidoreductase [Woeseiaceae bacterium]
MRILFPLTLAPLALIIFQVIGAPAMADQHAAQKAVLVTGASTGIGREIAETLAENGYYVYAGARKQEDLDALNEIDNIQAVRLDVTIQDEIDAAVDTVRKGGKGLYGLINNAGVYIGGPLIDVDIEEVKWLMDVNVFGVYRVTQAFAPMLIESKGRIATIGSISGILSGRFSGAYSMSKHAIEAYTDSLATEMQKFDVHVSVIEPGNYNSQIANTALKRMREKDYAQPGAYFAEEIREWLDRPWDRSEYKAPDEVAEAAMHALFSDKPLRRYMVVPNEKEAGWTIGKAMQEVAELNEWQAYSYSREQLIEKLDAAMSSEQ